MRSASTLNNLNPPPKKNPQTPRQSHETVVFRHWTQDSVPWEGNQGGSTMTATADSLEFPGCWTMVLEEEPRQKLLVSLGWGSGAGSSQAKQAPGRAPERRAAERELIYACLPGVKPWVWGKNTQKEQRHTLGPAQARNRMCPQQSESLGGVHWTKVRPP